LDGASTSRSAVTSLAPLFGAWASRVRARLALRRALTGATAGLALAVLVAGIAWKVRRGDVRVHAAWLAVAGAASGLAVARRRRWSDGEVALFLDARLASSEVIATAIALGGETSSAGRVTIDRAVQTLVSGDARRARPRLFEVSHAALPVALVALVAIARLPLPPAPAATTAPGESRVTLAQVEGLEAIAKLAQVSARDDAQRERLAAIARDAAALKERLRAGMDRRDAQDRVARLRETIDTERLSLGDGPKRAGLESAVSRLEQTRATRGAARALGDHDLQEMDEETSRVANAREKQDRALADTALDEAASAARHAGASDVGAALDAERQLLAKRAAQADALREMAEALKQAGGASGLGDDAQRALDSLDREGSEADARALAKALADAWSKLTPEEKARLAAKMAKQRAQAGAAGSTAGNAPPPDAKDLEDSLRAMADGDDETEEARRQAALDAAGAGAGQAEAALGGSNAGGNPGGAGNAASNAKGGGNANGDGTGAGGSHDVGTGSHVGATAKLDGETVKSRAQTHLNAAAAMPSALTTFSPGRPGDVATALATGDLRAVGSTQMDGVEKSDVPEEYRDHVRQYFNPTSAKEGPR
jgi:hypothetical protein